MCSSDAINPDSLPWPVLKNLRSLRWEPPITPGEFNFYELLTLLGTDNPVILDIGTNDGGHTLEFLKLFKNVKIYAFEPDPRAQSYFRRNVQDDRVKLFDLAISSIDGETEFHMSNGFPSPDWEASLPRGWDRSSSIRNPKAHLDIWPWCTFDECIKVQTTTLDTWCDKEGVESIDLIWSRMDWMHVLMSVPCVRGQGQFGWCGNECPYSVVTDTIEMGRYWGSERTGMVD